MTEETVHQIFQTPAGHAAHDIYHHVEGENEDGVADDAGLTEDAVADGVSGEVGGDFDE